VLMNLIVNAMQAMRDAPVHRRQLDIRTECRGDDCVEVSVIDTGHGMTSEQRSKAFDSFFTTKPDGMGLGLSIARSIVQAHGGSIWIDNNRETGGTAFKFTVPLRAPCAPGARVLAPAARRTERHSSQRGKTHDSSAGDDRRA
jgi:signal transduction histidine kinase